MRGRAGLQRLLLALLRTSGFHEMYFGTAAGLLQELATARKTARDKRLAANRAASCARCARAPNPSASPKIPP